MEVEFVLRGTFAEAAGVRPETSVTQTVDGGTVGAALSGLTDRYSDLAPLVQNSKGKLRAHVALTRNGEDVRNGEWLSTPVSDGDRLVLEPGVKGGC